MSRRAQITADFYEPIATYEGKLGKNKDGEDVILEGGREDQRHYAVGEIVDGEKATFFVGKGLAEWVDSGAPDAPSVPAAPSEE